MGCAKFYSLAHRFLVSILKDKVRFEIMMKEASDDLQSGNTMRDFQRFAYSNQGTDS